MPEETPEQHHFPSRDTNSLLDGLMALAEAAEVAQGPKRSATAAAPSAGSTAAGLDLLSRTIMQAQGHKGAASHQAPALDPRQLTSSGLMEILSKLPQLQEGFKALAAAQQQPPAGHRAAPQSRQPQLPEGIAGLIQQATAALGASLGNVQGNHHSNAGVVSGPRQLLQPPRQQAPQPRQHLYQQQQPRARQQPQEPPRTYSSTAGSSNPGLLGQAAGPQWPGARSNSINFFGREVGYSPKYIHLCTNSIGCEAPMRAQEELIFIHVHCRYGSAWGDIARHLPQQSPEALRVRWGLICETGRGCEQLLSDYAYNVKQGMPPAMAFFECVKRLPPGAKSRLLDGACSEHEFDQVSAALATAADLAKCQAIAEAALAGRTIRVSQDAEERAAALAAAVVAAGGGATTPTRRKKPAVRFGSGPEMHSAAAARMPQAAETALRGISGPAGSNSTGSAGAPQAGLAAAAAALSAHSGSPTPISQQLQAAAAAAAAAARAGSLMQDTHSSSSGAAAWPRGVGTQGAPGQLPSHAGGSAGVGSYPRYGSQKIATAKMAAEAYHAQKRQRWDDAARMRELWRQQQQQPQQQPPQQPHDSQRVTPHSQQSRQHLQQEHRGVAQVQQQQLTGTKRPHADSQQEQGPQPGGARGGPQQPPSFEQLRSSLAALASQGMPQEAAADMLQQIQSYLMGMKSGSGSAAAAQGSHSPAAAAAAASAPEFGGTRSTAAGTAQAAGAAAAAGGNGSAAAVSSSMPFQNLPPQLVAELKAAWKREQQKLQQKAQAQPTSTVSEPATNGSRATWLQQTQDDSKPSPQRQSQKTAISLMEDIYRLEQAVRQQEENIRRHQQQQQQQQPPPEPQQQQQQPPEPQQQQQPAEPQQQQQQLAVQVKQEGVSTQRSDGTVGGQSMLQDANKEDTSDSTRAAQHTASKQADGSRQGAFAAVKERLRQAPDRPEIINQVMAKLHVDLSDIPQSAQAACSPHSRPPSAQPMSQPSLTTFRSQSPASTGFEAAVKRNRQALLWEATAAVMDKREPVVRMAKPVHRGGTRRVISLEGLKATTLGKHTLTALQKLLLIPDELPAGARLVFEVAVPPPADAAEAAGTHTSGQQVEGGDAVEDGQPQPNSCAAEGNNEEQAALVEGPIGINMTQTQSSEHAEQQEPEAEAEQPPTATSAAAPSPFAAATAAAAVAAEALEYSGSVQQQTDKAGPSVGVVLVHAQAGLDSAMLSDEAVASTGSKRSRDDEQQEANTEQPLESSPLPSAKRSPRVELFL